MPSRSRAPEPPTPRRVNDVLLLSIAVFALVAVSALFFFDRLAAVPASSACSDGTLSGACSAEKPLYCLNSVLSERPDLCGCPSGFSYDGNACSLVVKCADGTANSRCSIAKPMQCINGALTYRASVCGCPSGYVASGERCVVAEVAPAQVQEAYLSGYSWDHMPVSYSINEKSCGSYESRKIRRAFTELQNATVISFKEVAESADIQVSCTLLKNCYEKKTDIQDYVTYRYESICSHKKGIAQTSYEGNKIVSAEISMVGLAGFSETTGTGPSGFYVGSCGHTTTELHEILHAFGYGHSESNQSIMYFEEDGVPLTLQKPGACQGSKKAIDADIIADLNAIYG